jgi:type II secretory pathway component GspD/PulD (secretin)
MSQNRLETGIAMSGAISAGAYSSGVFDSLIQALDAWEKATVESAPDLPDYDVRRTLSSLLRATN